MRRAATSILMLATAISACNQAGERALSPEPAADAAAAADTAAATRPDRDFPWALAEGQAAGCPAQIPADGSPCATPFAFVCFYRRACGASARVQCGDQVTRASIWDVTDESVCPYQRPACPVDEPARYLACDPTLLGMFCDYYQTGSSEIHTFQCTDEESPQPVWRGVGKTFLPDDRRIWESCSDGVACYPLTQNGCSLSPERRSCKCGDDARLHCTG